MGVLRQLVLCTLSVLLWAAGVVTGATQDLVHYEFKPVLGVEMVHSVEIVSTLVIPEFEHVERWSHEVVITLDDTNAAGNFTGTFTLRNVVNLENAEDDIYYLIAKSIEGTEYELEMYPFGMSADIDWVSIRARVEERLPTLTAPDKIPAIRAALTLFADPTKAVMRSFDLAGLTYVIPFRTDGQLHENPNIGGLTYFALDPANVEVGGGLDGEQGDYILDWLVTTDPQVATAALAPQLRSLATVLDDRFDANSRAILEDAIGRGMAVAEDGYSVYDLDVGLLREATIVALISSDPLAYGIRTTVKRLSP